MRILPQHKSPAWLDRPGAFRRGFLFVLSISMLGIAGACLCEPTQNPETEPVVNLGQEFSKVISSPDTASASLPGSDSLTAFFLEVDSPESMDTVVTESSVTVEGRTRIDAFVTINEHVVEPDIEGRFRQVVELEPGLNIIEIISSSAGGQQKSSILGIAYRPEE
ncbi:MAG: hypothetical protein OTJ98_10405 [Dehalococcoidia bacterium]|nr:hypothetical protein [Dehalococcoidia bacterium]